MVETAFEKQVTEVEDVIRQLQQTFECPICLDLMKDPVSTKCDHKFCRLCLLRVLRPRNRAPCPICKESITKRSVQVLPRWNAIVGKVAQLTQAFQHDTGCEFSADRGQTYVIHDGWTNQQNVGDEVSHGQVDVTVEGNNKYNSTLTRKRKAEGNMETVVYIEDVSQDASRPCNVKSHINISPAFPGPRCGKQRKTDCAKDVVDATAMDDQKRRRQTQEMTVATGNASSTIVIDLVTMETKNDELKANYENHVSQHVNDNKDCIVITNTKRVRRGTKPGCASGRRNSCTKNGHATNESELLACLVDEPLGRVSGTSAESPTVTVESNPPQLSLRSDICGKETSLPTGRVTRSKVMTGDLVALPNRTRRSKEGVENIKRADRSVDVIRNEVPQEVNHNVNSDDLPKICSGAIGLINKDRDSGDYDKTPEVRSKVMSWLQATADSVSPLSDNIVVIAETNGNKTTSAGVVGGSLEGVSTPLQGGMCTRSRGPQKDCTSSCAKTAVEQTAGRQSQGMDTLVDQTTSGHQAETRNADSADVIGIPHILKSPHSKVIRPTKCEVSSDVTLTLNTSEVSHHRNNSKATTSRKAPVKRIFRSGLNRSGQHDVNIIAETNPGDAPGVSHMDDPFVFTVSPGTPRRKKGQPKRGSRQKKTAQKRCIDVVVIKDRTCGRKRVDEQKGRMESKDECELSELVEKISEAESYDLLLSQQFRDMEQIARSEQQVEIVLGLDDVPDEPRERCHLVRKPGTLKDRCEVMADPGMTYENRKSQQTDIVELLNTRDKRSMKGTLDKPHQLEGSHGDGSTGEVIETREPGTMQLRRPGAGSVFPKHYGRKCRRECPKNTRARCEVEPKHAEKDNGMSVDDATETQTWSDVVTATSPSVRAQKTGQVKRKRRGKPSRQHWKKTGATSGSDEEHDAVLIVRRDEPVAPSGETETDVTGGTVSLTFIPESTLEDVTNGNQSQGHAVTDSNNHCSKSIIEDTQSRNDDHHANDLDLDNLRDQMAKERSDYKAASSTEYELDGVLLVPAKCGRSSEGSPTSVVVIERGSSDEDEIPCSNETSGFEPMQGFELHVNTNVESQMAPLEVPAGDSCRAVCIPHVSPRQSQTRGRSPHAPITHDAHVAGSQKAVDNPDVHKDNHDTRDLECLKESSENPEKSVNEKEDDCAKVLTEDQDMAGCDEVCSLRSSRKTFSLNSSPLLKAPRESLELHNVLCEAAEMMQETEGSMDPGSMDPDLLERNSRSLTPVLQKAPVSCAERKNSQCVPLDGASFAGKAVQKLSLKYGIPTTETSPKLPLDHVCETSEKLYFGDTRSCQRNSTFVSPAKKTERISPDHFTPSCRTREQAHSGSITRRSTLRNSWKQSACDPGDFGEISHTAEKSQFAAGKEKVFRKTSGTGIEGSPRYVLNCSDYEVPHGGVLSGDTESTLTTEVTARCCLAANQQVQPACGSADNLQSDTTYLSSDEVVLATTDASDDITPSIRVPFAPSFKCSKKVRKKSSIKKLPDTMQTAAAGHEDNLQNSHHVETSDKQIKAETYYNKPFQDEGYCKKFLMGKDKNSPACERGINSDAECIKDRNLLEEVGDLQGKGQTGDSVVMETMSYKSNPSEESEESSSLLFCIPPTLQEDTILGKRVNCTMRNSTQRVNKQMLFESEECSVGRERTGRGMEDIGADSERADARAEEEFSADIQENKRTVTTEAQTGSGASREKDGRIQQKLSDINADARAKINLCRLPSDGSADIAGIVQTVTSLHSNVVCEASVDSDKSSSVSKHRSGPRRRISARRSLWSQGSLESCDWLKSSLSAAPSTPLIPLVRKQSHADLEKTEISRGESKKCMSDEQINVPIELVSEDNDDTMTETGRHKIDRRVQDCKEKETPERSPTGGDEKRETGTQNTGDVRYSEMSTVDGAVMSYDEGDSSDHSQKKGMSGSSVIEAQMKAGTDGDVTHVTLSSCRVKGQPWGEGQAVRGSESWQRSSSSENLVSGDGNRNRSPTGSACDGWEGTRQSQTHSADYAFSNRCHDNLPNGEHTHRHSNTNTPSSNEGEADCEQQDSCHSDCETSDKNQSDVIDDDTDDISSTHSEESHRPSDPDTSDVDDFILPTPQKQKPILTVAMEIHSVVMDASDDSEPPSPGGATIAAGTCGDIDGNFADIPVKTEVGDQEDDDMTSHVRIHPDDIPPEGSTKAIPRQPVTPTGNPTRTVTALPTTPSQPVWVEDRDCQEDWERIRRNIDADLRVGRTDAPSPGEETGDRKEVAIVKVDGVIPTDSDEDGEFVVLKYKNKKKRKFVVQLESGESETEETPGGSTCRPGNMTSSSGLSSQSELPITQCKQKLETEVKCLQEQILEMEAAIAAGEGRNHGNSNHGDTVDCHGGSADRTMSETVQCVPATSSGKTDSKLCSRNKKVSSCDLTASPRSSQLHETLLSGTTGKSSQLSRHSSHHDDDFVNLVDSDRSDDEKDPLSNLRHGKVQRHRGNDRPDTREIDMLNQSHSSASEELGCHGNKEEECDGGENEDVNHGVDRGRESHTDVEDGEMEEECCGEGDDSGLDSDEDLFALSDNAVCIPQTLSQEGAPLKSRYVPPLLTSTPRLSHDPSSLPPSKLQTASHGSTPPGGDKLNYLDDEDILPSLEADVYMADQSCSEGTPGKTFDVTFDSCVSESGFVKNRGGLLPRNCVVKEQHIRTDNSQSSTNQKTLTKLQRKKEEVDRDDLSRGCVSGKGRNSHASQNKNNLQNYDLSVTDGRKSSRSVDVKRNIEKNTSVQEIDHGMNSRLEKTKKDLPCQDHMQMGNKTATQPPPVTMTVVPPCGRHQKETPSRGVVKKDDFPERPEWVFVASGISKTTQQPCIERLVRLLGAKFVSRYSPAVTHVLVNAVPPGGRRCTRTLKYFQGIAGGKWVVNVHWALDSLTTHSLQPMEDYEISSDTGSDGTHNAPQRARCSSEPLLHKYEICCHGNFKDLTRDDLCGLAEACGAMTIQEPSMFTFDPDKVQVIIVENSTTAKMAELQKFQRRYQVALAQKEWLLDSISVYNIQPLEEYVIDGPALRRQ